MRIDVFTLFPECVRLVRGAAARRATRSSAGSELRLFNYRDSTPLTGGQVDDSPYGGGAGMVLRVDVVDAALQRRLRRAAAAGPGDPARALGPPARRRARRRARREPHLALLCGRYEGVDERVREHLADDAISVGPYVLSGGELAAMVVADAVMRKLPGALGHAESAVEESFSEALEGAPEYPHYTRPASYRGWDVPEVLLSGDHARVREWRLERSREPRLASRAA